MIEVENLTRRYGPVTAVDGISFGVGDHEIVGILGPNGAGKTTTIRMITGFLPPSEGSVTVAGHDLLESPLAARREIGYLPENVALYPEMRVDEYLKYRARLEGVSGSEADRAIDDSLDRCLLSDVRRQTIGTLSKGYRQRVGLAQAILHQPRVLVLDEPTVGLDPKQIIAIRDLIRELGRERTLLLSTHILPEVELLCDRILIIDRGRVVASGTPAALRERWQGSTVVKVTFKGSADGAREALEGLDRVASVSRIDAPETSAASETKFAVACEEAGDPREDIFRLAVARDWILLGMNEEHASLEDIFVRLTTLDQSDLDSGSGIASSSDTPIPGSTPAVAADEEVPS